MVTLLLVVHSVDLSHVVCSCHRAMNLDLSSLYTQPTMRANLCGRKQLSVSILQHFSHYFFAIFFALVFIITADLLRLNNM